METLEQLKQQIDSLTHYELCQIWRFGDSSNKLLQGEVGEYFRTRLFDHFGGFDSSISKSIGW
jgi:hypothetical protein